ncbi:MAG: hypothetical protein JWR80_233 [Bradyrhizobium sp.]|nr:hypothetical protein [Bradyrhizobium sp.]
MPIETNFSFQQIVRSTRLGAVPEDLLGLLRGFVGNQPAKKPQRSWKGPGFNMIWRPNFDGESGPSRHFLQLNMTEETLEFTDITGGGIANRGLLQKDIALGGVAYIQSIDDSFDNTGQHFEPGVWAHVPKTDNPNEPTTVVRMGSIPHGTTINMQGTAFTVPQPRFDTSSITPFRIGSPDDGATDLVHFPEEDLSIPSASRTNLARVASLTQAQLSNPNLFLSQAIAGQTILSTTVLIITSDSTPPAVPDAGGGVDNIAFLVGTAGGPNANVPRVTAIFWIERVKDAYGYEFDQLQYTQRVLLDFGGLSWPHVTVATLRAV